MPADGESPWLTGRLTGSGPPVLLFGCMYEDWRCELDLFPKSGRIFCIASAGCTAMALSSHGYRVTAVDVNPAQVRYARQRLDGEDPVPGKVDRLMAFGRFFLPSLGLTRARLRSFLALSNPVEQSRIWNERLDTRRFRTCLAVILHPLILRGAYRSPFLGAVPRPFAPVLRRRLARGWATHANRDNPYAWRMFLGEDRAAHHASDPVAEALELVCADAAEFLESCPADSFDGLTLSNILDGAPEAYGARLLAAARRAGRPGCPIVLRSFSESEDEDAARRAGLDRSLLWGSLRVF